MAGKARGLGLDLIHRQISAVEAGGDPRRSEGTLFTTTKAAGARLGGLSVEGR
jgi:hypothetical protein